jgi:hypothetical protein
MEEAVEGIGWLSIHLPHENWKKSLHGFAVVSIAANRASADFKHHH